MTNLTGADEPVTLESADKGGGDRWDPEPQDGEEIAEGGQVHWASDDPPPGGCHTEARLTLARDGDPDVVWTVSATLSGDGQPALTCDTSDDAFPCVVGPDPKPQDGELTALLELHAA